MQIRHLLWTFSGIVVFLSGCASGKEARDVARVTLEQIITYEELVESKMKSEQLYYKESVGLLQESLKRGQVTAERAIVTRAAQDFQNYASKPQNVLQEKYLRDSIDKLLDGIRQSRARYANALTEYGDLLNSLEALETHKQSLQKVRKGLEHLQMEPSDVERLKEWFEFGKKTKEEFEKSKPPSAQK